MKAGDIIGLATLAAVILAIWLGRRKGRQRLSAAIAAAHASGRSELQAEISATAVATGGTVNILHARTQPGDSAARHDDPSDDDLFSQYYDQYRPTDDDYVTRERAYLRGRLDRLGTLHKSADRLERHRVDELHAGSGPRRVALDLEYGGGGSDGVAGLPAAARGVPYVVDGFPEVG